MTPERAKVARESRSLSKTKRASQTVTINDKWKIVRADEYNWQIVRKGKENEPYFYGRLIDALLAIPHKMLDEAQLSSLKDILEYVKDVCETLERLRFTKFEDWSDNLAGND